MDFGFFVKKLRQEGKIKLHFETEQELLNLLQDVHVNGFDCVNSSTYEKLKKVLGEKFKKYDFVKVECIEEDTIQFAEPYAYNCYIS